MKDPWLNEGCTSLEADVPDASAANLPLVSREHLLEEEHTNIIQRMVNGSVGSREDIIEALDCNEYNHITATYFLLAERKLRAKRPNLVSSNPSKPDKSKP